MKRLPTAALSALLMGSLGLAGLSPAFADNASPPAPAASSDQSTAPAATPPHPGIMGRHPGMMMGHGPGMMGHRHPDLTRLLCTDRGGEALEIAFIHIKYDVKLTAAQQPLFDTLRTAALADQKTFAAACQTAMKDRAEPGKATLLDRMQTELAIDSAKVSALQDVVPKLKAFYDSLTDEQKAELRPQRAMAGFAWGMPHGHGWGMGKPGGWGMSGHQGGWHRPGSANPTPPAAAPQQPTPPADPDTDSAT